MTTIFRARSYGRFMNVQSNLRRKKNHRMNQGSNFLGRSFSNRDNARVPMQFRRERQPSILKGDFLSRTDSSIFTLGWTLKNLFLASSTTGCVSRVGWSGFFFVLVKVSLVPRALPVFDISLVTGKIIYPKLLL